MSKLTPKISRFHAAIAIVSVTSALSLHTASARAEFVLSLDDPATVNIDVIIVDGGAAGTGTKVGPSTIGDFLADGDVAYFGSVGTWAGDFAFGLSKPDIGGPNDGIIELRVSATSSAGGTLDVLLTDTDYLLGLQPGDLAFHSEVDGDSSGTVSYTGRLDRANNEFGIGPPAPDLFENVVPNQSGAGFFAAQSQNVLLGTGAFSLTEVLSIVHSEQGGTTILDTVSEVRAVVVAIPEPSSIALAVFGLVSLGFVARRRRRRG